MPNFRQASRLPVVDLPVERRLRRAQNDRERRSALRPRSVVAALRDVVPIKPLAPVEALRIAELQANLLLKLGGIAEAPVPESIISALPRIQVEYVKPTI